MILIKRWNLLTSLIYNGPCVDVNEHGVVQNKTKHVRKPHYPVNLFLRNLCLPNNETLIKMVVLW